MKVKLGAAANTQVKEIRKEQSRSLEKEKKKKEKLEQVARRRKRTKSR